MDIQDIICSLIPKTMKLQKYIYMYTFQSRVFNFTIYKHMLYGYPTPDPSCMLSAERVDTAEVLISWHRMSAVMSVKASHESKCNFLKMGYGL